MFLFQLFWNHFSEQDHVYFLLNVWTNGSYGLDHYDPSFFHLTVVHFYRCNSHYSFQHYSFDYMQFSYCSSNGVGSLIFLSWDDNLLPVKTMRFWMLTGSSLWRFFFKDLIKVHPFSSAYGTIIIGFMMLLFSPSVVSMCRVGGTICLLKSFLTSLTTSVINQCGWWM